jgi:peptidoglycan hydrolase-like amidase
LDEVKFEIANKYFTIKDKNDKIIKEFVAKEHLPVSIECKNRKATFTVYDVTLNKGYFWAKNADRSFRGSLEIIPGPALTLINTVYLDEYLYSVVPSEIGALSNKEALMAQAVIARSYVYNKI